MTVNYQTGEIPDFVLRGIVTRTDPADVGSTRYSTEADLRDSMAAHWWLHGWNVRTEVRIPDCGRVDVLAEAGMAQVVIELKKRIESATAARQAYQQAHAYEAYLRAQGKRQHTLVTAGEFDHDAVVAAERAYLGVWGHDFITVANLAINDLLGDTALLAQVAASRRRALTRLLDAARAAEVAVTVARESDALADTG